MRIKKGQQSYQLPKDYKGYVFASYRFSGSAIYYGLMHVSVPNFHDISGKIPIEPQQIFFRKIKHNRMELVLWPIPKKNGILKLRYIPQDKEC